MFTDYSYDRQEANSYYDKATTSLTLVVLNHILSAADAAWSVSMFNKDLKSKNKCSYGKQIFFFRREKIISGSKS